MPDMMELFSKLCTKKTLDTNEALSLLKCLQDETAPFLSSSTHKQASTPSTRKQEKTQPSGSLTTPATSRHSNYSAGQVSPFQSERHSHGGASNKSREFASSDKKRDGTDSSRGHFSDGKLAAGRGGLSWSEGQGGRRTNSKTDESVSLDLSSVDEFPPMTPATVGGRKKSKLSSSAGPPRRIKPTPLHSHHHTLPHFTTPTATHNHSNHTHWKSDPAFTLECTSSDRHIPFTEERRLLQQKKQKLTKSDRSIKSKSSLTQSGLENDHIRENIGHLQNLEKRLAGGDSQSREDDLDSKISNHSIFSLTNSSSVCLKTQSPNLSSHSNKKKNIKFVSLDSKQHSGVTPTSLHPPMTSTPIQRIVHTSLDRTTNVDVLEHVADLYSSLINGGRVPNLTSEVHFVVQLLTLTGEKAGTQNKLLQGSSELFESLDNCVYFAVAVLSRIKRLLVHLDKPTLRLLAENPRVVNFQPGLAVFFSEACENTNLDSPNRLSLHTTPTTNRVPFQEDTDNSKNFPHMKAFHTFKKQRDLFYSIFREWEGNHDNPGWTFHESEGDKMRLLIRQYGEVCSLSHLASLFQKQLIESCRHPLLPSNGDLVNSGLARQIKNADPQRLMRLTERFFQPSATSGIGPCPPPSFTATEDFFKTFIMEADSYVFNQHLKNALYAELTKLHQTCSSVQPKDVPDLLHSLRTTAKFLGFLEFLPYKDPPTSTLTPAREMYAYDLLKFISDGWVKGHLCLTIPWVVQYLSMMDPQAIKVNHYRVVVTTLMDVYTRVVKGTENLNTVQLLIVTSLGWLFEIPNVPNELFFDHLRITSLSTLPPPQSEMSERLDSQSGAVSTSLLYTCCPYLSEIRSLLTEFAAGLHSKPSPIRKIKPLSTSIDKSETSKSRQIQVQLQDNFFRGHPPYLKQLCDITSERVAASAIAHCMSTIVQTSVALAMEKMADWMKQKCHGNLDDKQLSADPFTKEEGEWQLHIVMETIYQSACRDANVFINKHCTSQTEKALDLLLTESISSQVITATSGICSEWAIEKCNKWISEKLRGILHEEVGKGLERSRRLLKTAIKSGTHSKTAVVTDQEGSCCVSEVAQSESVGGLEDNTTAEVLGGNMVEQTVRLFKQFKVVASHLLSSEECEVTSDLFNLLTSVHCLVDHLNKAAFVIPDVPLPQVLPTDTEEICALSVKLAIHLICFGILTGQVKSDTESVHRVEQHRGDGSLLETLVTFWTSMKGLKQEVSFSELLGAKAFDKYFNQKKLELVWESLSFTITTIVQTELVSSSFMEGMWLCRHHQLPKKQQEVFLRCAAVFLQHWYTHPEITCQSHDYHMTVSRHSHFTRLLCVVVNQLDHSLVPRELLAIDSVKLIALVHPFSTLSHNH